jgi:hypothetical protein
MGPAQGTFKARRPTDLVRELLDGTHGSGFLLDARQSAVSFVSRERSRVKIVEVEGLDPKRLDVLHRPVRRPAESVEELAAERSLTMPGDAISSVVSW